MEYSPQTELERAMAAAKSRQLDFGEFWRMLGGAELLIPVAPDVLSGKAEPGTSIPTIEGREGVRYVPLFTSEQALEHHMGPGYPYTIAQLHGALRGARGMGWGLILNAGAPFSFPINPGLAERLSTEGADVAVVDMQGSQAPRVSEPEIEPTAVISAVRPMLAEQRAVAAAYRAVVNEGSQPRLVLGIRHDAPVSEAFFADLARRAALADARTVDVRPLPEPLPTDAVATALLATPPFYERAAAAPEPGWYADPWGKARLRWWDGAAWTGHTSG